MNKYCALSFFAPILLAAAADNAMAGIATATRKVPVSFTITADGCSSLPAGTVLQGTGLRTDFVKTQVAGAVTREIITSHAYGKATDQLGNTYAWDYSSQQNDTNTPPSLDWAGSFVDHFSLTGNGPAHIVAGFVADVFHDTDYTYLIFTPHIVIGDPIGFDDNAFHCDPM